MQRLTLYGRVYLDDAEFTYTFAVRRVLSVLLRPFGDVTAPHKSAPSRSELRLSAISLSCVLLLEQSDLVTGAGRQNRFYCVSRDGDVRLIREPYGFQTLVNDIRPLGKRRVACSVEVLREKRPYARLNIQLLRISPQITPATLRHLRPEARDRSSLAKHLPFTGVADRRSPWRVCSCFHSPDCYTQGDGSDRLLLRFARLSVTPGF